MIQQPTRYNPAIIQPMERAPFIGMSISSEGEYVLYADYAALEAAYKALVLTKEAYGTTTKE